VVTTPSFDELGLARAARSGDERAFDALVGPLIDPAFKLAFVFLRDTIEAEDAVQEACLRAWKKLDQLHPGQRSHPDLGPPPRAPHAPALNRDDG
jgi:DNA-directed RNA polymerase specialized sigma24 family protein